MLTRYFLLAVTCCITFFSPLIGAADTQPVTIRIMTVVIVQQGNFLQYLLEPYLQNHNIRIEYSTGHHNKVAQAVKAGLVDLAITHTKVKRMQKLEQQGVLMPRVPLFANPKAFLGPPGDPAKLQGIQDAVQAMQQIQDKGMCYLINPHDQLKTLQEKLLAQVKNTKTCINKTDADALTIMDMAVKQHAYTMWGLHPYLEKGDGKLQPVVVPDKRLLQELSGWVVSGSAVENDARQLLDYLHSDEVKERIKSFKFPGFPEIQPWFTIEDKG